MPWTEPLYTRAEVDAAGATIAKGLPKLQPLTMAFFDALEEREKAIAIANNWRSAHGYPLNSIQMNLRAAARKYDVDPIVAQRIKRFPSIEAKLERLGDRFTLSEMQDLGGCRAVVDDVDVVRGLFDHFQRSRSKHEIVRFDDYISRPKRSGYRGIHIIWAYRGRQYPVFDGMHIEMQLRTRLQHAWATSVEVVGTFTRQSLKSSAGDNQWLRFFVVMSAVIAAREDSPRVPKTPADIRELLEQLGDLAQRLRVLERLRSYDAAVAVIGDPKQTFRSQAGFLVLELDTAAGELKINPFANSAAAADAYAAIERATAENPAADAVLVRTDSVNSLRRAYPNYFADTKAFRDAVRDALARRR